MAVQASSFVLCILSTDGGMRSSVSTPLRSCPDDLRLAQSNGPYPGASATFFEGFFGRSVVAIGASKDDEDATCDRGARGTPGCLLAKSGRGGGGISFASSLRIVGIWEGWVDVLGMEDEGAARCALFRAGNAGGTSSSPAVLDPSSSSSSCHVNDPGMAVLVDTGGGAAVSGENQLRRKEDI